MASWAEDQERSAWYDDLLREEPGYMTLLPTESRLVTAAPGRAYTPALACANPDCSSHGAHTHELWRRSFLSGDHAWVQMPSGRRVRNKVRLCHLCHQDVTENKVHIRYLEDEDRFYWVDLRTNEGQELDPHPFPSEEKESSEC